MAILAKLLESRARKVGSLSPSNPLASEFFAGVFPHSGVNVNARTALTYSAVYRAICVLAGDHASLPLCIYRRLGGKAKEKATDHPLYQLLHNQPNPEQDSFSWRETLMGHLLTWGNCYCEIDRVGDTAIQALWPIMPETMEVCRDTLGHIVYNVRLRDGGTRTFQSRDILHIRAFSSNGLVGLSPITLAREAIGLGLATEQYGNTFFGNGAMPAAVLEHPGRLSDKAKANVRRSWKKLHGGVDNAHEIAILQEGMTLHPFSIPPDDAQFLETRKFSVNEIARWFGLPPHKLGDLERATFSNIEQQALEYVMYSLRPWLIRWEACLLQQLVHPREQATIYPEFVVDGLLRGDSQARYQSYQLALSNGILSINEVRALENRNPIGPEGDIHLVPLNLAAAGTEPEPTSGFMRTHVVATERRASATSARMEAMRTHRGWLQDSAQRIITRETRQVRRAIGGLKKSDDVEMFHRWLGEYYEGHAQFVERTMSNPLKSLGDAIYGAIASQYERDESEPDNYTEFKGKYVASYTARHVRSSRGQLTKIAKESEGEERIANLEARLDEWDELRSERIGRREAAQAASAFALMSFRSHSVEKLRWVAGGSESCPYCQEMDGRIVGVGQTFVQQNERFAGGEGKEDFVAAEAKIHPPLHDGCECYIEAV